METRGQILIKSEKAYDADLLSDVLQEAGYFVNRAINWQDISKAETSAHNIFFIWHTGGLGLSEIIGTAARLPFPKQKILLILTEPGTELQTVLKDNGYNYLTEPVKGLEFITLLDKILHGKGQIHELLSCPECKNPLHSQVPAAYQTCPSCGTTFNKHGRDRRREPRIPKATDCTVYIEGTYDRIPVSAKTIDISNSGIGIRYSVYPLPQNSIIELAIADVDASKFAIVAWSKNPTKVESMSGLYFLQPIQPTLPPAA